jgi:4-hydroxy-tetrahydrodipicolinate reductase
MADPVRIGVAGALGRMGRTLVSVAEARPGITVAALFDRPGTQGEIGPSGVLVSADTALEACDVIVDFTTPIASVMLAEACARRGGPALVIGTTGFSEAQREAIRALGARIPLVRSGNFSLGVNVLAALVEEAARRLGPGGWDAEIIEAHHRGKVDAPSGTALMLGEAVAAGREVDLDRAAVRCREGLTGPRESGSIGFSVLRGGGIVGEHQVVFASEAEILTLAHSARDRSLFAEGALTAAAWLAGKPAGYYEMRDVLGFSR